MDETVRGVVMTLIQMKGGAHACMLINLFCHIIVLIIYRPPTRRRRDLQTNHRGFTGIACE